MTRRLTYGISAFALIATSATPTFAEVTEDNTPTQEDLDAMCMAEPSIKNRFEATAVLGERQQIGEPQIEYGPAQTGPNYDDPQGQRGELLSPNEFKFSGDYDLGYVMIGVNVFNLYTTKIVRTEAKQTQYKMNFDCHVHKSVNGKGNDPIHKRGWLAPPDQQIFGLQSAGYWIKENRDVVTFASDIFEEFFVYGFASQCMVDGGEWSIYEYFDLGLNCDVLKAQYEAGEISIVNGYDIDGGDGGSSSGGSTSSSGGDGGSSSGGSTSSSGGDGGSSGGGSTSSSGGGTTSSGGSSSSSGGSSSSSGGTTSSGGSSSSSGGRPGGPIFIPGP